MNANGVDFFCIFKTKFAIRCKCSVNTPCTRHRSIVWPAEMAEVILMQLQVKLLANSDNRTPIHGLQNFVHWQRMEVSVTPLPNRLFRIFPTYIVWPPVLTMMKAKETIIILFLMLLSWRDRILV